MEPITLTIGGSGNMEMVKVEIDEFDEGTFWTKGGPGKQLLCALSIWQ